MKTGYIIIESTKWIWNKPITYLSLAIKLFQFLTCWKWKYAKWNHSGVICVEKYPEIDECYVNVYHTGKKVEVMDYFTWISRRDGSIDMLEIENPNLSEDELKDRIKSKLDVKYDVWSLVFFQLVYRLTFKKVWLGKTGKKAADELYCSEYAGYANKLKDWWKKSTSDYVQEYYEGKIEFEK